MKEISEQGIEPGIGDAGYDPRVICEQEFLGKIDDAIIAEVRKSGFMVADLTGQRQNVYYEAGFAEGLGLSVVYTCSKKEINQCHFDKRQENFIAWETAEELRTRLKRRIEATIEPPKEANNGG
jgi:hypothetical protein